MITPVYNRTSSDTRMTAADMNRICANINEICGGSLRTNWTSNDIVDEGTWEEICDLARALGYWPVTYQTDYINVNYIERSLFDQYDAVHHITAPARLTGLSLSNGTLSPAFNSTTYVYTATVASLNSIVTATTDYSAIGYKVNGSYVNPANVTWQPGTNTLQVTATLNGQTVTYTVTVTCTYQPASLNSLTIDGNVIPVSSQMTYVTENASDTFAITATGTATVKLNGQTVTGSTLNWQENSNTLQITVTADDTKVYTVTVDCLYVAPIPATVGGIYISDATMVPVFSPGTTTYYVYPEVDTDDEEDEETEAAASTIEVITEEGIEATIYFNGTEIENGSEVEWTEGGGDIITVVTTATDEYTSVTYTITAGEELTTEPLAPMRAGEFIAGDPLPGEGAE